MSAERFHSESKDDNIKISISEISFTLTPVLRFLAGLSCKVKNLIWINYSERGFCLMEDYGFEELEAKRQLLFYQLTTECLSCVYNF